MNWRPDEEVEATGGELAVEARRGQLWRRFRRDKLAMLGLAIIVLLVLVAVFAPLVARHDPHDIDAGPVRSSPSKDFWFGTDGLGQDMFSRTVYGTRVALEVGLGSMVIAVTLGVILGALAGWYGGLTDTAVMRSTDVLLSLPYFILGVVFLTAVGPSTLSLVILLGITGWLVIARVVRASFLQAHELEYVEAARALGYPNRRIMFRHVLPNTIQPVILYASIGVGTAVLAEASFAFLNVGSKDSWGQMIVDGKSYLTVSPHLVFFPGGALFLFVLAFVLVGEGIRKALDPREHASASALDVSQQAPGQQ